VLQHSPTQEFHSADPTPNSSLPEKHL
jgi:hypothetical protein